MNRRRKLVQPAIADVLEARWLLAAPVVAGNLGQILNSQFQPLGFTTTVGTQLRDVSLGGPLKIDVTAPAGQGQAPTVPPANYGLIAGSQTNAKGFRTVGVQLDGVRVGGGLSVTGFDTEGPGAVMQSQAEYLLNKNLIDNAQVNDGGFGIVERGADGKRTTVEGRVGLQWRDVRVRGSVNVQLGILVFEPGASGTAQPGTASVPGKVIDLSTNSGQITNSQFNDGGFGDIGMQWSKVAVGGNVATSSNSLFIKPQQDGYGPITYKDLNFGASSKSVNPAQPSKATAHAAASTPPFPTTYTNSATNSGRVVNSQMDDGGFGDIGLQWQNVRVGGSVTAVHNSLTVQPENKGQGFITVQGIQFPTTPTPAPSPREPSHAIPDDPTVIASDGDPVSLATPTGPLSPYFPTPISGPGTVTRPNQGNYPLENSATNSGLLRAAQFNAGGFGDEGLQWQKVRVAGNVQLVHNSLSVHPEGSKLAGISVSDVSYGPPVSQRLARHLKTIPYLVISTGDSSVGSTPKTGGQVLHPPNNRWLTNQQLAAASGSDVFVQWNGIEHNRGLVLVHNIILISGVGPQTGPITLSNIRFPFRVPTVAPLVHVTAQPAVATAAEDRGAALLNTANNSGVVSHAQFSDGGFGDIGMQWRNVSVGGSVSVVHNTLAVDESSDLPTGDVPGPITISNVTFNSGALDGPVAPQRNQVIVSPPDVFQRVSSHPINLGRALPQDPRVRNEATNTGILAGGQLSSGGTNHVMLQWQCVKVPGRVTVVDNVLSISVQDRATGPITISNVTFA